MILFIIIEVFISSVVAFDVNDDIFYEISWLEGSHSTDLTHDLLMKTENNESYSCVLPMVAEKKNFKVLTETESNETALLSPFFEAYPCIYKIEGYWTYELCHGKHIRQFRSEIVSAKSSQIVKEFYLGYFSVPEEVQLDTSVDTPQPKSIRLNGRDFSYFEVKYDNGSVCDLTGGHRVSHVLYICVEESNGELFQISEIESCVYQLIVFTKELCKSSKYNIQKSFKNVINCRPHGEGTPKRPHDLDRFIKEKDEFSEDGLTSLEALFGTLNIKGIKVEKVKQKGALVYRIRTVDTLANEQLDVDSVELKEPDEDQLKDLVTSGTSASQVSSNDELRRARTRELQSFMNQETCLTGGVGWWRYEICHGTRIVQYHENPETREKNEIVLGVWNADEHRAWIEENPVFRPVPDEQKRQKVSLYYGNGDLCDEINARRSVILTLQCQPSIKSIVQLSFSEPTNCQYSISLESALLCNVVQQADADGILPSDVLVE